MYERDREMWADLTANGYFPILGNAVEFPSTINGGVSFQDYMEAGDIGNFDDRMRWIENSMLPEWRALEADPDAVLSDYRFREILRSPFDK